LGDISEYRGIIVIFTFLGVFALLISTPLMPSGFTMPASNMTSASTPSSIWQASGQEFGGYNETWEYRLNQTLGYTISPGSVYAVLDVGTGSPIKFGGHDLDLWYVLPNVTYYGQWIMFRHNYGFSSVHEMQWFDKDGVEKTNSTLFDPYLVLSLQTLQFDYAAGKLPYKVQCVEFYMACDFWYNTTTYANLAVAFNHNDLHMMLGINFNQMGASFDSASLVTKLLTFQPVDVPFPINIMMAFGIWAAIAYIVFIIVLRVIGSVFGGGGA
jgi:hypothetical protein